MARRTKSSQLGIEIGANEIRVVETLISGNAPVVMSLGSAPCPPGSYINGRIHHIDVLSLALKRLLDSIGAKSNMAVFGVPSAECISRQFNMPPAPDEEMRILVDGEVRHYGILQSLGGVFDFFRLKMPDNSTAENPIVLVAAEEETTANLRDLAGRCGLTVAGVEPGWIGQIRACQPAQTADLMTITVCVQETSTEVIATFDGSPFLYRHLEIGMNSLLAERLENRDGSLAENIAVVMERMPNGDEVRLLKGPLDSLVVEVKRSADFILREFGSYGRVTQVNLTGDHFKLPCLIEPIRATVEVPTAVVLASGYTTPSATVQKQLDSAEGHTYLGAYGLSLHNAASNDPRMPTLDLASHVRTMVVEEGKRRVLTGALFASILIAIVGGIGFYLFQRDITESTGKIAAAQTEITRLQAISRRNLKIESEKAAQVAASSTSSIDVIPILDIITNSLAKNVGLREISMKRDTGVHLVGESTTETGIVSTVEQLQKNPDIKDVSIESFENVETEDGTAVKFQIIMLPTGYGMKVEPPK